MNTTNITKVKLAPALLAELDAIPTKTRTWTAEMDATLLHIWPTKSHVHCIKWWKKKYLFGCKETLTKRYCYLTEGK